MPVQPLMVNGTQKLCGQQWMLPSELEWEKAARGVGQTHLPVGNGFEATWACMRNSTKGSSMPSSIDSYPVDTSPYGLRHMAGNLCEWTRSVYHEDGPLVQDGREVPRSEPETRTGSSKVGPGLTFQTTSGRHQGIEANPQTDIAPSGSD